MIDKIGTEWPATLQGLRAIIDERDRRYEQALHAIKERMELATQRDALALSAAKDAVSVAMQAAEKAVTKAEAAAERRFESINEFRGQMADMQTTFARTDLVSSRFESLEKKIDELAAYRTSTMGRSAGMQQGWGWIVSGATVVAAVVGAVVAVFFKGGGG